MRFVKVILVGVVVFMPFAHSGSARTLENNNVVPKKPILIPKVASGSIICSGSYGGPDGYGYTWLDSDTTAGPVYNWIEISSIGTRIEDNQWYSIGPDPQDDGTAGPLPIGFDFPFHHLIIDSVYVGTNGIVSLSDSDLTYDGYFCYRGVDVWIPQWRFSDVLPVFWRDLNLSPGSNGGGDIYYWTNADLDTFIVEYKNIRPYSDSATTDTVTFQIILTTTDSSITYQYQSVVTTDSWFLGSPVHLDSTALIGIQDHTRLVGLQYFNGDENEPWFTCYNNLPHSGLAVKFRKTVQIERNLLAFKWPLSDDFWGNQHYDPYPTYYIKEIGDVFDNNTVRVLNIGRQAESGFSVFCVISIKDSLGNSQTIDSTSVLVSTLLLPDDSCDVAFSTGWQPEARGFYLVTYRVALPTDQFPSDDTTYGLLVAERTKFTSNFAQTVPTCDGIIETGEWDDATKFDISYFAMPIDVLLRIGEDHLDSSACFAYVKNDSAYIYFAFDVPKDTNDTQSDEAALYIDDNGDSWFEADSSEGNFYVYNRVDLGSDSLCFMAHVSNPALECYADRIRIEHLITDWEFSIANNSGHQQFEIAIPRGTDPKWKLNFVPGESIGVSLIYLNVLSYSAVGYWPATGSVSYRPCKMGKIYLSQSSANVQDFSEKDGIPEKYSLFQNYPNPFNPQTSIQYDLPKETEVRLTIYNILGRRVKILVDERQKAGYKEILWNGKDEKGKEVSSGIYFYRIQAGDFSETKKMVVIK